jgi:hypothetical protein
MRALSFAAALSVALSPAATATVVIVPTLEEMTHRSDVVIHAMVREVKTIRDEKGRLLTVTALEVQDGIAGAKQADIITVHQLGGRLGDEQAWIAGAHKFVKGEEIVFFGERLKADPSVVVPYGVGFGIFAVLDDVDGKHAHEIDSGDVTQLVRLPDGRAQMAAVTPRRFDSLTDFKAQLRAIRDGRNAPPLPAKKMQRPQLAAPALPSSAKE